MRSRRPLVLVVHDNPDVRVAQANDVTRAGYRCLVAGDPAAALLLALKFAFEMVPSLYSRVVLVTPDPPAEHELPAAVATVAPGLHGSSLVEAVARAASDHRRLSRMMGSAVGLTGNDPTTAGATACL